MTDGIEIYQEERPWGYFRKFTENAPSTVKTIKIAPGQSLSLQSHKKRKEFWRVIAGHGTCEIDGIQYDMIPGDEKTVEVGAKHRLTAGESGIEVLEIAIGEFDENDIERYQDNYGRA